MRRARQLLLAFASAATLATLGAGCTQDDRRQTVPMQTPEIRASADMFPSGTMQVQATVK